MNIMHHGLALQAASVIRKMETEIWLGLEYENRSAKMLVEYTFSPFGNVVNVISVSVYDGKQWNVANWLIRLIEQALVEEIVEMNHE